MLRIAVLIKQVPEIGEARINPITGTLDRKNVTSTINPIDLHAIELAIQIKEKLLGTVVAFSMGPQSASKILRESLALGCDNAILITGKEFAASDTWATSYVLANTIRMIGYWDIIISGEKAIDGDTGQVGPEVASFLELPILTYVNDFKIINEKVFLIERLIDGGFQKIKLSTPFFLTVTKGINTPRLPTLDGKIRSHEMKIEQVSIKDLTLDESKIGLKGSPTRVVEVKNVHIERNGKILRDISTIKMAEAIIEYIKEKGIIDNG
jgi:electron transfer flavoprotein beta subunit